MPLRPARPREARTVIAEPFTILVAIALALASLVGLAGVIAGVADLERSRDDLAELKLSRR